MTALTESLQLTLFLQRGKNYTEPLVRWQYFEPLLSCMLWQLAYPSISIPDISSSDIDQDIQTVLL